MYLSGLQQLETALDLVQQGSAAVGMALGLQKCGAAHMTKGKVVQYGTEGGRIKGHGNSPILVPGGRLPNYKMVRKKLKPKFETWVNQIWSSSLR